MHRIYKYAIPDQEEFTLDLPAKAEALHVDVQHNKPFVWALVDPDEKVTKRTFRVVPTGVDILESYKLAYVGTFLIDNGNLVFHLFEKVMFP